MRTPYGASRKELALIVHEDSDSNGNIMYHGQLPPDLAKPLIDLWNKSNGTHPEIRLGPSVPIISSRIDANGRVILSTCTPKQTNGSDNPTVYDPITFKRNDCYRTLVCTLSYFT